MLVLSLFLLPAVFAFPTSLTRRSGQESCPTSTPPSCPSPSGSVNSCCVETHGSILQTQFWDVGQGPSNSWTIHGLWVDDCDGSYRNAENCDSSRTRSGSQIESILSNGGAQSTLDYMRTYWLNNGNSNPDLWSHEWNTHGTCFSTLNPSCYDNYVKDQEIVEFFETVVSLFKQLPTYDWLTSAGIKPSSSATYTLAQLESAAKANFGYEVTWGCASNGELYQVFYGFTSTGAVGNGYLTTAAPTASSSCPKTGIKWLPK